MSMGNIGDDSGNRLGIVLLIFAGVILTAVLVT